LNRFNKDEGKEGKKFVYLHELMFDNEVGFPIF
jgi:hypothetical protein